MKTLLHLLLLFAGASAGAQTVLPPVYTVDRNVYDLHATGDTLIVAGDFLHVGRYTGGMALFTTASDQPDATFPRIDASVNASTPDGSGGCYILTGNADILHVRGDKTFDTGFRIRVNSIGGDPRYFRILHHQGIIYVGGAQLRAYYGPTAGELIAFDTATKARLTGIPVVNGPVTNLRISGGTLYLIGNFDTVGGLPRKGIAAIRTGTNTVSSWYPALGACINPSFSDIAFYGSQAIIGGSFYDFCVGGITYYKVAVTDTSAGTFNRFIFPSYGIFGSSLSYIYWAAGVHRMALEGNMLYVYTGGTFDTRLTAADLSMGDTVRWARFFNMTAGANDMIATGGSVFVGGAMMSDLFRKDSTNSNPANIQKKLKNVVRLDGATGALLSWDPAPSALISSEVKTLCLSGTGLMMGGSFDHVNTLDRPGIFMMQSSTQTILPFRISGGLFETANSLRRSGDTLFAAGDWTTSGNPARTVRAFSISNSQEISLPVPYLGAAYAIETDAANVFVAGNVSDTSGGIPRARLIAIDRQTGQRRSWSPAPDGDITALHIRAGRLYVAGHFSNISGQSRTDAAAYDLATLTLLPWKASCAGPWNTLQSDDSLVYLGGSGSITDSGAIDHVVAVRQTDGAVARWAPVQARPGIVRDLLVREQTVITGAASTASADSCGAPFIYQGRSRLQRRTDLCMNLDEGSGDIYALALSGADLYYGGKFLRTSGALSGTSLGRIRFPAGYFGGPTGVAQSTSRISARVYPNPANDVVNVDFALPVQGSALLQIMDITGRTMLSQQAQGASGVALPVHGLSPGMYFIRITLNNQTTIRKFRKQ